MEDKKKKLQVLQVNLLKLWVDREALFGDCEDMELGPEAILRKPETNSLVVADDRLDKEQLNLIKELEKEFPDMFSAIPDCTHEVEHSIETLPGAVVRTNVRTWP